MPVRSRLHNRHVVIPQAYHITIGVLPVFAMCAAKADYW